MAAADRLVYACQNDTGVLTSLRAWLAEEREALMERAIKEENLDEVLRLQGAAKKLHELATRIAQMVKIKSSGA